MTEEEFNALLDWLDPDRDQAGEKYEIIRRRLIRIFISRGCNDAEEIADETINRVMLRLPEIRESYVGDPALYFYGVAHKVYLEYRRKPVPSVIQREIPDHSTSFIDFDETERRHECLGKCMLQLPKDQREMMLQYYADDKRAKIDHRKELAENRGITLNALRICVYRIRLMLEKCVRNCLEQQMAER
ncbi:MAG: hypothetical protein AUG51_00820 [Acidobacteria bacterium 13_1_20CM_3_53_8]|nr:MAG: hypothetical protein AUG51_00820 [Acidobacteria bacterium 13_1_20CM_3_53_8]